MANIIDYVSWRGDLTTEQAPLGEIDALIFSYLSYMPFDGIVPPSFDGSVTLAEAAQRLLDGGLSGGAIMDSEKNDHQLLALLRDSARFGGMRVAGYASHVDGEAEQQFAAVTFLPESGPAFAAFRGTDDSVVGWKEDFNLAFSSETPSQRDAVAYAEEAARHISGKLILGGHSKGGNLAVYAGIFAGEAAADRLVAVYNFDGPGFNEAVLASPAFLQRNLPIHTFVPQTSVIGILLWHAEPFAVVRSDGVGVWQHNPYTWQLMGGRFTRMDARSSSSQLAEETIKNWISDLSAGERQQVIDGIYSVLSVSDGRRVADLFEPHNVVAILRAAGGMDAKTRGAIAEAFRLLGASLREAVPEFMGRTAEEIRQRLGTAEKDGGAHD
ncbi:MAG: DUF2974 domain-containing protein [Clostridia bacterium]|nr:DUF2974 domain-containing protein [Clostridia bacterium]